VVLEADTSFHVPTSLSLVGPDTSAAVLIPESPLVILCPRSVHVLVKKQQEERRKPYLALTSLLIENI
jgi:hypothetical protein